MDGRTGVCAGVAGPGRASGAVRGGTMGMAVVEWSAGGWRWTTATVRCPLVASEVVSATEMVPATRAKPSKRTTQTFTRATFARFSGGFLFQTANW